jgi:hypothetical protein
MKKIFLLGNHNIVMASENIDNYCATLLEASLVLIEFEAMNTG